MKKKFFALILLIILLLPVTNVLANEETKSTEQEPSTLEQVKFEQEIFRAKVLKILSENRNKIDEEGLYTPRYQVLVIEPKEGKFKGEEIQFTHENIQVNSPFIPVEERETVTIYWNNVDYPQFSLENKYRLNKIALLAIFFFALVIALTRLKGVRSIISLFITFAILVYLVAPQIAAGASPVLISFIASVLILGVAIIFGHGLKKYSVIAFISATITLVFAIILSYIVVHYPDLNGFGNDDAFWLNIGSLQHLNLQGLLLAGIIISIVGILDDVTIVQASVVEKIHKTNKTLGFKDLYKKGIEVGKDHIISMVNTLIIIYAGIALPILLYLTHDNYWDTPWWARLNQPAIVEEIARSLAGSMALVFAVPITTLLAAYYFSKKPEQQTKKQIPRIKNLFSKIKIWK